ncbi:MAG: M23 family metallopeptidase [Deltaproteobacteria bacterium]|nr:M23 family metallopeptidase [Deltaproteobacteria bacterium]
MEETGGEPQTNAPGAAARLRSALRALRGRIPPFWRKWRGWRGRIPPLWRIPPFWRGWPRAAQIAAAAGGGLLLALLALRLDVWTPSIAAPGELVLGLAGREVQLELSDSLSGLRSVSARLRHAEGEAQLLSEKFAGGALFGGRRGAVQRALVLDAEAWGLPEGAAQLRVVARDWSWSSLLTGRAARLTIPLRVDLSAPRIAVLRGPGAVRRGGAGAVRYRIDEPVLRDGVSLGGDFFPGYPRPGAAGERIAIFAFGRNARSEAPPRIIAEDIGGNHGASAWSARLIERKFEDTAIRLSRRFLQDKVLQLAAQLGVNEPNALRAFQFINREQRARDEKRIRQIIATSEPRPLFAGGFLRLPRSAVTSRFAERRNYMSEGARVSQAIHYGYDLASVAEAEVPAANSGRVLFAGPLGIYGNCVILDHGLGLTSLYAHLSSMAVAKGERVERGAAIGRTGSTGLAGGDHLHFAILVGETYVDPQEWWDAKWLRDFVESALR